jgi:hypothetical protein
MKTNSSKSALIICLVLMLMLSACGASTPAATSTLTATVTSTIVPTFTATVTLTPTKTPLPTTTPNLAATQKYEDFFAIVQRIHEAGQIPGTDGQYLKLDDYSDEVATKLSYEYAETGISAKNFIVRGDFEWSNAVNTTNISGCGFVYRVQQNTDHYLVVLDAFSGVKLASSTDRGTYSMGSPQNGDEKISDFGSDPYHATFTLVVNDLKSYVYVNDVYQGEYKLLDYRITDSGLLSGAVLSATSEGYGTRCNITNIQVWIIDP